MIKIILEINEESKHNFKDFQATGLDLKTCEIGKNATEAEIKASSIIKEKLGIKNKVQIINECRNKNVSDILNKIYSI